MSAIRHTGTTRAQPLYFGPPGRPRFGWLHKPPSGVVQRAEGLVVCNPFGIELLSAHRSLRHFAEEAAALGLPALRFDYDGTGDSAGTDRDPDRWDSWLKSVHDAVDELRRQAGVERVHLLGLRLGAALAAIAASQRQDVAGLVALVPVVSGRQWLRELDALQGAMRVGAPPAGVEIEQGIHEAAGFVMMPETRASLAAMDLLALPCRPAESVLLISRSDLPPNRRLAERLASLGAAVDHRPLPGYAEMMLDAHDAVVPAEMIQAVCGWLDERSSARSPAIPEGRTAPMETGLVPVAPGVEEAAVFLDRTRTLFGIVSAPSGGARPTKAVLLLNSGANHRIAPSRLYVQFARHWAARGHLVLRLDLSGLGDSLPRPGERENEVYARSAISDVGEAVSYLQDRWGASAFTSVGVCSGAYHSLKAAAAGVALGQVISINPLVFFWKPGMSLAYPPYLVSQSAAQYRRSLFQLAKWKKLLMGRVDLLELGHVLARRAASIAGGRVREIARKLGRPLADDVGAELEELASRNVKVAFVFAVGNPGDDMLRVQAGPAIRRLSRGGHVRFHRIRGPNHTFTPLWSHAALLAALDEELGLS